MKKYFLSLIVLITMVSCSDRECLGPVKTTDNPVKTTDNKVAYSRLRSIDEALSIADKILGTNRIDSRSAVKLKGAGAVHVILADRSRSSDADTLLYALDVEGDGGFVLVAAPNSVEPIMAIVDNGSFSESLDSKNEAYQITIDLIKDYVSSKSIGGGTGVFEPVRPPIFQLYEYYDTVNINRVNAPSVAVAWNQSWPENTYAPNGVAGCVPVAIAQALSVMEKPSNISYSFPGRDINNESLDWIEIKKHKQSSSSYTGCVLCSASQATHKTIGRFVREIGHLANANYATDGSGTGVVTGKYIEDIIYKYSGIRPYSKNNSLSSLFSDIDFNGGVAIVDYRFMGNNNSGHAFIADGTKNIKYQIIRYQLEDDVYVSSFLKNEVTELIHYNWGWGGSCNGWFNLKAVDPSSAAEYDNPSEFNYSGYIFDKNSIISWYYKI